MAEKYVFNHYIQKAILKKFSHKNDKNNCINIFNINEQCHMENDISRSFGVEKLYWDDSLYNITQIEEDFNTFMENSAIKLIKKVTEQESKVYLKRVELFELKRYILGQIIRTESSMEWFSRLEDSGVHENLKIMFPQIDFKIIEGETHKDKWLRGIKVLLRNDFLDISKDKDITISVAKLQHLLMSSYFGFWKCSSNHEFIVSDIAVTNESDLQHTKENFVISLLNRFPKNKTLLKALFESTNFHENFWMFPVTPKFMIVLINPLFKSLLTKNTEIELMNREIRYFPTTKVSRKLFEPNEQKYINSKKIKQFSLSNPSDFIGLQEYYTKQDNFIYKIHKLSDKDSMYLNMLMLDRVNKEFGYRKYSKVVKSVNEYLKISYQRNIYTQFDEKCNCE